MPVRDFSDDEELLRELGEAVRPGAHEQQVLDAGRMVWGYHSTDLDRALAALLYDSRLDVSQPDGLAGVRGPAPGARNLVFALGELRVEIEVSEAGIEGQLIPPEPGTVTLLDATGPVASTVADEVGCFAFPAGRHGPVRIECEVAGRRMATEWITH